MIEGLGAAAAGGRHGVEGEARVLVVHDVVGGGGGGGCGVDSIVGVGE